MKGTNLFAIAMIAAGGVACVAQAAVSFSLITPLPAAFTTGPNGTSVATSVTNTPGGGTVAQTIAQNTVISQTFTPTISGKLDGVQFVGSGGATTFSVHLYQFAASSGYVPATSGGYVPATSFTAAGDLFNAGAGLSVPFGGSPDNRVFSFDLTGADEVNVVAGTTYAFEIWNPTATSFFIQRAGETYAGGSVFQATDPAALSSTSTVSRNNVAGGTRDAVFAAFVSTVPEPTSLAALAVGGVTLLRRRRRA